jgi:hypothetical protein
MYGINGGRTMVNQPRLCGLIFTLSLILNIGATELLPSFGDQLEFEGRLSFFYSSFSQFNSDSKPIRCHQDNLFTTISLSNSPIPEASLELECTGTKNNHTNNSIDNIRITGRWLWWDDLLGDSVSLATGVTLTKAFTSGLKNISSFHHGLSEIEAHLSIGRESSSRTTWKSHWWAIGAIGVAEKGSLWLRADAAYEYRICDRHEVRSFLNSLWGLGHRKLHCHPFHGYGDIAHRSIDLGIRYSYLIPYFGDTSLEYAYRIYAYNFPENCQKVMLQILYLF